MRWTAPVLSPSTTPCSSASNAERALSSLLASAVSSERCSVTSSTWSRRPEPDEASSRERWTRMRLVPSEPSSVASSALIASADFVVPRRSGPPSKISVMDRPSSASAVSDTSRANASFTYEIRPAESERAAPIPDVSIAARKRSLSANDVWVAMRSAVTSEKAVTTPVGRPSVPSSGCALTRSHTRPLCGRSMPMMAPLTGSASRSACMAGCVSPGQGEPSGCTARHRGSVDTRPLSSSAVRPSTCSAARFQLWIPPSGPWTTSPSARVSRMSDLWRSLSPRRTTSSRSVPRANSSSTIAARSSKARRWVSSS